MRVTYRLFLLVAVALLPAVLIQARNEIDLRRSREAEVREMAQRQAWLAVSEMSQILGGVRNLLTAVAEVPAVRALDHAACTAYLADLLPKVPHLVGIVALDLEGRVACPQERAPSRVAFADRPYFREALASGGFIVGAFTQDRITGRSVLPLALPLEDPSGRPVGVLAAKLSLDWLNAHLRERALARGGSLTIVDKDGVILARDPMPERFVGTAVPEAFLPLVHGSEPGVREVTSQDGTRRVLGYVPSGLTPYNLYISAGLSADMSYAAVDRGTVRGVATIVVGLLLALAAAALVARRFVLRPLAALRRAAAGWQAGDYAVRSNVRGGGEFALLGAAFDRTVEEIAQRESALRVSEARLRAAIETLPFDFWICDAAGRYVLQNSTSRRNWGERVGLLPEQTDSPPEVVARWVERNRRVMAGETLRSEATYVLRGEERTVEDVLAPIESDGTIVGYVGVNIDVTEQRRTLARQQLLLRELSHRVKNTLATVQVIVNRSLQAGRSLDEARTVLLERLKALATTHDLLTASGWGGASLRAIASAELAPYGKRAEISGEDVVLTPRAAQTLALILHELATNAAKHGAWSVATGSVRLGWQAAGSRLRLEWREQGGPATAAPLHRGFGRTLIEEMAAYELDGCAVLTFQPEGVVYHLDAPADGLLATG